MVGIARILHQESSRLAYVVNVGATDMVRERQTVDLCRCESATLRSRTGCSSMKPFGKVLVVRILLVSLSLLGYYADFRTNNVMASESKKLGFLGCEPIEIDLTNFDARQRAAVDAVNAFLEAQSLEEAMVALNKNPAESNSFVETKSASSRFGTAFADSCQNDHESEDDESEPGLRTDFVRFTGVSLNKGSGADPDSFTLNASLRGKSSDICLGKITASFYRDANGIGRVASLTVETIAYQPTKERSIGKSSNGGSLAVVVQREPKTFVHYEMTIAEENAASSQAESDDSSETIPKPVFQVAQIAIPSSGVSEEESAVLENVQRVVTFMNEPLCLSRIFERGFSMDGEESSENKELVQSLNFKDGDLDIKNVYHRRPKSMRLKTTKRQIEISLSLPYNGPYDKYETDPDSPVRLSVSSVKIENFDAKESLYLTFHSNGMLNELSYRIPIAQLGVDLSEEEALADKALYDTFGGIPCKRQAKWNTVGELIRDETPEPPQEFHKNFRGLLPTIMGITSVTSK